MKKAKIKFTPEHNWVELKRKVAAIGITDYLIGELGDLIDLCLPKVGEELIYGISYGEIESINILHDLIAPLSGEIVKVNSDLSTSLKVLQNILMERVGSLKSDWKRPKSLIPLWMKMNMMST